MINIQVFYISIVSYLIVYVHGNCKLDGCPNGLCCSEYGFCGDSPEHCNNKTTTPLNSNITIRSGDCRICGCESNLCCSSYGYCGTTKEHCEKITIPIADSELIAKTRIGDCRICGCGDLTMCCSPYGYCGNSSEYCENQTRPNNTVVNSTEDDDPCKIEKDKSYRIISSHGFLHCKQFSASIDDSTVVLWPESETNDQEWQFLPINNNTNIYSIQCKGTGRVLTIGKSFRNFTELSQWSYDSEDTNQHFKIVKGNKDLCILEHVKTNQQMIHDFSDSKYQQNSHELIVGLSSETINMNGLNLWMLSETDVVINSRWNLYVKDKTGYLCMDHHRRKSSILLTLTECLQWCESRKQSFCMWNYLSNVTENVDDEIFNTTIKSIVSSCWGTNKCNNRTLNENEKYHIYKLKNDESDINEESYTETTRIATLDDYVAYTKYLLLEANGFDVNSEPLMCSDLDPNKETVLTFENSTDGIRLCDLCPNLPPFDKFIGVIINQFNNDPLSIRHNMKFDECFMECVSDKTCIAYSYSETKKQCITFDKMNANDDRLELANQEEKWTSVLVKQPTGIIQDWFYIRNTRISRNGKQSIEQTFLQCLQLCRSTVDCSSMTYDFRSKSCELFNKNSSEDEINTYLSYGFISAINFEIIYGNNSNIWRFVEEEKQEKSQSDELKVNNSTVCQPSINASSNVQSFYNSDCFITNRHGCHMITGCQDCVIRKLRTMSNDELNLPICPTVVQTIQKTELREKKKNECMTKCFLQRNPACIAVEINELTSDCEYRTTYVNWTSIDKSEIGKHRYWLQYPQLNFQFIPNCDFDSSSQSISFDECIQSCTVDNRCQKISYNFDTLQCKISLNRLTHMEKNNILENNHCFIRPFIDNNDLSSVRMAYERTLSYKLAAVDSYIKQETIPCSRYATYSMCLDVCLNRCVLDVSLNSTCQYVSTTYEGEILTCTYFQNASNLVPSENSDVYSRYFNTQIDLDVIDKMPLFNPMSDTRSCFFPKSLSLNEQTYSTLKDYRTSLTSINEVNITETLPIRQRRLFGFIKKAVKWVGKNIVKPLVDTAKEVIETPIKAVKTVVHLAAGDTEAAKEEFMSIGIVKDAKNLVENSIELGKAVGKGDFKGALEHLGNVALDVAAVAPVPVGGKIASKIGKIRKNPTDNIRKTAENQLENAKKGSRKTKRNTENHDGKKKKCKIGRTKRGVLGKHDRDCDSDEENDEEKKRKGRCARPSVRSQKDKIDSSSLSECHGRAIGSKCKYDCEYLYQPSYENGVTCQQDPHYKKRGFWEPKPKCEPESCPHGDYPLIPIGSKTTNAYVVLYDKKRKLPIWSMCLLDRMNRIVTPAGRRVDNYNFHPCPQLKSFQAGPAAYVNTGYDHGHLTPSEILSYSYDASFGSNLRINLAPQGATINQVSWRMIEAHINCHNNKSPPSLVVTGVCPNSLGKTKSRNGVDIPSCFWKMICYERSGKTHVVGFLADNTKLQRTDRSNLVKILKPVSQEAIIKRLASDPKYFTLKNPFLMGYTGATKGRLSGLLINTAKCTAQTTLDSTEAAIWEKDLLNDQAKRDKKAAKKNKRQPKRKKVKQNKSKRSTDQNTEVRGCTPAEASEMAALFGLSSLSIYDDANFDIIEDDGVGDNDDDDETFDEGGDNISEAAKCGKRIIGYYPSWGTGKISSEHAKRLTHIIFAFFEVDVNGNIFIGSADRTHSKDVEEDTRVAQQRLKRLSNLQKAFPNIKYLFAVGGWENSQYFSSIAASPDKRVRFIASALKLIDEHNLDGIDIDWEHPVTGGAVEGIPEDRQNYVLLMKELRQALDNHRSGLLLTFASAAGQWTLDPGYDLPALLQYADFVNVMTYDFFGAWDSKWGAYTGPPAPLYFGMPPRFSGKTNVHWTIKYYVCKTKMPHKINMGVPFYGRYWKNVDRNPIDPSDQMWRRASADNGKFVGGFASWKEIKESWLTSDKYKEQFHEKTKSTFAFNSEEQMYLGYESPKSLEFKAQYAAENNLGGLMIWAIDQDDDDLTMMNIVGSAPLCKHTNPSSMFYKCSPLNEKRWWTLEDSEEKAGMCGRSAPLYKGYYPVCDPDDPGYSCCSPEGFCGKSDKHCNGLGINYEENPGLLVEEPIKPTIDPPLWYLLDAPDGKRGRCGPDIPPVTGNIYPICNPDDQSAHCCSNGGYCGTGDKFCSCDGCVDFKKDPSFRFKPKT